MVDISVQRKNLPKCTRCDSDPLLMLHVPCRIPPPGGGSDSYVGLRTVVLCPGCDAEDPIAQGVLAFFAVHSKIDVSSLNDVAVIREWMDHHIANVPVYSDETLDQEIAEWRSEE